MRENRNEPMEGLRGVAVSLVFLVHYCTLIEPWIAADAATSIIAETLHSIGNSGVDLFFVLSGFLIYGTLVERPQPFGRYILRRVERIYPAFLVVLAIYIVLSLLSPGRSKLPADAPLEAILRNIALLPGLFTEEEPIVTVAWSLSYEMFFYLTVPLVAILVRTWTVRNRLIAIVAISAAAIGAMWTFGGPMRASLFLGGMVLFEALNLGRRRSVPGAGLVIFAASLGAFHLAQGKWTVIVLLIGFPLLCYVAFSDERLTNAVLCWRPLRALGNASYSYYLAHGLGLNIAFHALALAIGVQPQGAPFFWGLLLPMFAVTLIPSLLLYRFVERPLSLDRPNWLYGALTNRFGAAQTRSATR